MHHQVQNCHHHVQEWGKGGDGLQVDKHTGAAIQGDHNQVREIRGKAFVLSLLRGDPQHCPVNLHIGQHNGKKTLKA